MLALQTQRAKRIHITNNLTFLVSTVVCWVCFGYRSSMVCYELFTSCILLWEIVSNIILARL